MGQYQGYDMKVFLAGLAGLACAMPTTALSLDKYFTQMYYSQFSDMALRKIFTNPDRIDNFKSAKMLTLGVGGENLYWKDRISLGAELNGSFHWGYDNQQFYELSTALFLRFNAFPWRKQLPTSITVGDGLSYTPTYPRYEYNYGASKDAPLESRLLNFLFLELSVGVSRKIELFARLHHRCTAWGVFADQVNGGSNFPSIGLRYTF
jgi:hypothetical protein